jgi:hypothetical protein
MLLLVTRRSPKPVASWVLSVSLSHPSCHILPLLAFVIHVGPDIHMNLIYVVQSKGKYRLCSSECLQQDQPGCIRCLCNTTAFCRRILRDFTFSTEWNICHWQCATSKDQCSSFQSQLHTNTKLCTEKPNTCDICHVLQNIRSVASWSDDITLTVETHGSCDIITCTLFT